MIIYKMTMLSMFWAYLKSIILIIFLIKKQLYQISKNSQI